jgi:D-lactate dehydrogenase (cytochrome)
MVLIRDDREFLKEYLKDESRLSGKADSISFPLAEQEIQEVISRCGASSIPITVQGSRTGITGGAVPLQGHILNLSRMNKILGLRRDPDSRDFFLEVEPGLLLKDLRLALLAKNFPAPAWSRESQQALAEFLEPGPYFFPPDPTETTASLGGMAACNASGACSYHYGATRGFINALSIVLADSSTLRLERIKQVAKQGQFQLHPEKRPTHGQTSGSGAIRGLVPSYKKPAGKNAAGYFSGLDIDLVDLFIGSEGTLGVISSLELKVIPAPRVVWGGIFFFSQARKAVAFVSDLRKDTLLSRKRDTETQLSAIEFFDRRSLELISTLGNQDLPTAPGWADAALYLEVHGENEDNTGEFFLHIAELVTAAGEDAEKNWLATNVRELKKLTDFRHAVPEAVNLLLDTYKKQYPDLTKLGTDMSVPDHRLMDVFELYESLLKPTGQDYAMFGHIGDNHLHVNIIPRDMAEYRRGKELYNAIAHAVLAMDGTISSEHGIGKLKTELLKDMYGEQGLRQMRELKACLDPQWLLNRGNLFSYR